MSTRQTNIISFLFLGALLLVCTNSSAFEIGSTVNYCKYIHNGNAYSFKVLLYGECPIINPPDTDGVSHKIVGDLPESHPDYFAAANFFGNQQKIDDHECVVAIQKIPGSL